MPILEKPLTFEDYQMSDSNINTRRANVLIKALNDRIRRGETKIPSWSSTTETVETLSLVSRTFKKAGWGGLEQKKNEHGCYSITLFKPE